MMFLEELHYGRVLGHHKEARKKNYYFFTLDANFKINDLKRRDHDISLMLLL